MAAVVEVYYFQLVEDVSDLNGEEDFMKSLKL